MVLCAYSAMVMRALTCLRISWVSCMSGCSTTSREVSEPRNVCQPIRLVIPARLAAGQIKPPVKGPCSTFRWELQPDRAKIPIMEPVTTVTAVLTLGRTAADVYNRLYEYGKGLKDRDAKQQVEQMLRFKSDDYEFHTPFWYAKNNPQQALCPKCFAGHVPAPMGEHGQDCNEDYRKCLVCGNYIEVAHTPRPAPRINTNPWS